MKVFLGLHKAVDDKWTSGSGYLEEPAGVLCRFDDGSAVAVTFDGRVLRFDSNGIMVAVAGEEPPLAHPGVPRAPAIIEKRSQAI